jgi:hypothetical protein
MTYDEALVEAVSGARVSAAHLDGVYIEHSLSRGFLKCWPVDTPDDEPNRASCDFKPKPEDLAADWFEVPIVRTPMPPRPDNSIVVGGVNVGTIESFKIVEGWGKPVPKAEPEVKAVLVLKDGAWVKETPLTPQPEASKWGAATPKKEPGKWGK